jgi:hypothetical protein
MVIRYYGGVRVNVPPYTKAEDFEFYRRMAGKRPDGSQGSMVIARSGPRTARSAGSAGSATSPPSAATGPAPEPAAEASPADPPKGKGRRQPRS